MIIFRINCNWGKRLKTRPNPVAVNIIKAVKPPVIPRIWGIVLLNPKLAPEAVSMMLFGPGVMQLASANRISG